MSHQRKRRARHSRHNDTQFARDKFTRISRMPSNAATRGGRESINHKEQAHVTVAGVARWEGVGAQPITRAPVRLGVIEAEAERRLARARPLFMSSGPRPLRRSIAGGPPAALALFRLAPAVAAHRTLRSLAPPKHTHTRREKLAQRLAEARRDGGVVAMRVPGLSFAPLAGARRLVTERASPAVGVSESSQRRCPRHRAHCSMALPSFSSPGPPTQAYQRLGNMAVYEDSLWPPSHQPPRPLAGAGRLRRAVPGSDEVRSSVGWDAKTAVSTVQYSS